MFVLHDSVYYKNTHFTGKIIQIDNRIFPYSYLVSFNNLEIDTELFGKKTKHGWWISANDLTLDEKYNYPSKPSKYLDIKDEFIIGDKELENGKKLFENIKTNKFEYLKIISWMASVAYDGFNEDKFIWDGDEKINTLNANWLKTHPKSIIGKLGNIKHISELEKCYFAYRQATPKLYENKDIPLHSGGWLYWLVGNILFISFRGTIGNESNNETGFLCQEHDVEAMTTNIIKIFDDRNNSIAMGEKGKRHILSNFPLSRHIDSLDEIMNKAYRKK